MAKEGYGILAALVFSIIVLALAWRLSGNNNLCVFAGIVLIIAIFTAYFFRDPEREIIQKDYVVLSPGDGKIVEISQVPGDKYLQASSTKISIFLSLFDVHISRVPMGGEVEFMRYQRGKFLPASRKSASLKNEQTIIGIKTKYGKLLFKQIAGILARRIVCYLREGDKVNSGEKFGMIKFGSRMEVYIPEWASVEVTVGDKVKAGLTILGKAHEK